MQGHAMFCAILRTRLPNSILEQIGQLACLEKHYRLVVVITKQRICGVCESDDAPNHLPNVRMRWASTSISRTHRCARWLRRSG